RILGRFPGRFRSSDQTTNLSASGNIEGKSISIRKGGFDILELIHRKNSPSVFICGIPNKLGSHIIWELQSGSFEGEFNCVNHTWSR
ncbi:hypothetical protein PENTCL1PPCAC_5356, partial [Pristionchus entomophagus]